MKIALVAALAFTLLPAASNAQQPAKVVRIGVLSSLSADAPRAHFIREGLRERGYAEGRNLTIEWRPSLGKAEGFPSLAAELVKSRVDVIMASDNPAIAAAQAATKTIPIVMLLATDPVATGFVVSLARPGGNVTGLTMQAPEIQGKSLQLLREALPQASRTGVLWDPDEPGRASPANQAVIAARVLGLRAELLAIRNAQDVESAFSKMSQERFDSAIVQPGQVTFAHRKMIAELAASKGIATMAWSGDMVEAGMLMAYGASIPELYRRGGYYVDRILRGAKPEELPVEQPTRFELVVNLKTAKRLGITLPKAVVARADRVIE